MDIRHYFARIGYAGSLSPTAEVLCALQQSHLLAVPFENLDIHAGRRIMLNPDALFHKIVTMRRGGFCYELNGLFHLLLIALGFDATLAQGRVFDAKHNTFGPPFDHMLILTDIDGQSWLTDVGFGDFALCPLQLALDQPLHDKNGEFLIERADAEYLKVSRLSPQENRYIPEYLFSTRAQSLADFSDMCLYHQTSPESRFTRQRVCSITTRAGRTTLTDDKLIITENGRRTERPIGGLQEFNQALAHYFGP